VIRSGVQHDVRFFGYVPYETLKVFYKSAEIFAFPSLYEGFGLPPLEAMANGTPVLTSNVSSLPEVMGNAALLVNPENVFEICKGLKHLLFDFNLRAELIAKGLEQSRLYSWKKSAELVWQTYQRSHAFHKLLSLNDQSLPTLNGHRTIRTVVKRNGDAFGDFEHLLCRRSNSIPSPGLAWIKPSSENRGFRQVWRFKVAFAAHLHMEGPTRPPGNEPAPPRRSDP
jgi:hypothetical protein